jgi:hypothetical protein
VFVLRVHPPLPYISPIISRIAAGGKLDWIGKKMNGALSSACSNKQIFRADLSILYSLFYILQTNLISPGQQQAAGQFNNNYQ